MSNGFGLQNTTVATQNNDDITTRGQFGLQDIEVGIQDQSGSSVAGMFVSMSSILFAFVAMIMIVGFIVTWIMAFVQVIQRKDLKENRLLWILLLFVVGPLGVLFYAFLENRKTFGYWVLACYVGLPVVLLLSMIVMFVVTA
jgi:hypothetical protein